MAHAGLRQAETPAPQLVGFAVHCMGPRTTEMRKSLRKYGWRGDLVRAQPAISGCKQGHGGVA
eukprot:883040-Pyramimonas_sp.AAC.1